MAKKLPEGYEDTGCVIARLAKPGEMFMFYTDENPEGTPITEEKGCVVTTRVFNNRELLPDKNGHRIMSMMSRENFDKCFKLDRKAHLFRPREEIVNDDK